ncbi:hypothetical protein NUACC26_086610 [Scytonema sp. NUACC26]
MYKKQHNTPPLDEITSTPTTLNLVKQVHDYFIPHNVIWYEDYIPNEGECLIKL